MADITYAEAEGYWIAAGGKASLAPTMAAIAVAESSLDPTVVNSIGATGLWQINQPVWVSSQPTWTQSYLQNPLNNAKAAVTVYNQQGLSAWTTYSSGAYQQYMQSNVAPVTPTGTTATSATDASDSSSSCCAIGFGGILGEGSFCILSESQVNSIVGGFIISAGIFVGFVGVAWILVFAVGKSKVVRNVTSMAGPIGKGFSAVTSATEGATTGKTPGRASQQSLSLDVGTPKKAAPKKAAPKKQASKQEQ
jgi:hypothetical protein